MRRVLALLFLAALGFGAGACASTGVRPGSGSLAPYTVHGKRYVPLKSADGFQEEGIASWYGPNYHGKKTSSGETFDTYSMTAAHPILPMNTCVEVTNLTTRDSVVVRINDRGPFVAGRVIDLSCAAAKELACVGTGTARVHLRAVGVAAEDGSCGGGSLPSFWTRVRGWWSRLF